MVSNDEVSRRVGRRVADLRDDAGKRQDDVARAARWAGLNWTRSVVAAIENGNRTLTPGELLALPTVLHRALDRSVTLPELLDGPPLRLTDRLEVTAGGARAILRGDRPGRGLRRLDTDAEAQRTEAALTAWLGPLNRLADRVPDELHHEALWSGKGEAEQKAARALDVPAGVVGMASYSLWGSSLTDERERRLAEKTGPQDSPRTLQARRGHITRQLLAELREAIDSTKDTP